VEVSVGDRNRIMQKKDLEGTNARWNEYLNERGTTEFIKSLE
jgi:hypothetical protein